MATATATIPQVGDKCVYHTGNMPNQKVAGTVTEIFGNGRIRFEHASGWLSLPRRFQAGGNGCYGFTPIKPSRKKK